MGLATLYFFHIFRWKTRSEVGFPYAVLTRLPTVTDGN